MDFPLPAHRARQQGLPSLRRPPGPLGLLLRVGVAAALGPLCLLAQEGRFTSDQESGKTVASLAALGPPIPMPTEHPLAITLPAALQLANVRPLDIAAASERTRVALAQLQRSQVLWLPTIYLGFD